MPRIQAPTVAEHRVKRRKALLDAARDIWVETGEPPSIGQVGKRVGLARSSVYQYFTSVEEILTAVAAEVFPAWTEGIHSRVAQASSPGEKVWAYVEGNFALFSGPEFAVAQMLTRVIAPQDLHAPMKEFHRQLQVPLQQALADLNEPEPVAMAELIDALIVKATHDLKYDDAAQEIEASARSLSCLRRLIAGYLGLPSEE